MEQALASAAVSFARALRGGGMTAGVDEELTFCRALAELDVRRRSAVYWAARACFVRRPEEVKRFDEVFARFWDGLALELGAGNFAVAESDPRMPGADHGGESTPQLRQEGRSSHLLDGQSSRATREIPAAPGPSFEQPPERMRRGVLAAYSPQEALNRVERLSWHEAELAAVRQLAHELRESAPVRRSRRARPGSRHGRLDLRRTLRGSLRTDGELLDPAWSAPSLRPRRLLVICDVSGSMERYSRALLAALGGIVGAGVQAEAFVFATRLTRLTGSLAGHDVAAALERARSGVPDWSGGTRIGEALADFNRTWARRGLARGAIVIVVSDGWDRGDPDRLAAEVARLRLQARRLVWINPRPVEHGGDLLAVGMRAARPHVDDFVAGHDPRALAQLARLIRGLGSRRPQRPQRAPR